MSYGEFSANINLDNGQSIPFTQYADGTVAYFPDGAGGQSFSSQDAVNQYLGIAANQNEQWTSPDTGAVTNFYTDGTSVTGDPPTTTTGSVTLYKDGEPPITQPSDSVAVWKGMGWSTTPPAFTNNAVTTDASELMNQINADTALTNVGTDAAGTYVIKSEDTLSAIAFANGVTVADLMAANPKIENKNEILLVKV